MEHRPLRAVAPQALYYLGWIAMVLAEALVWAVSGIAAGLVVFALGGWAWGTWQAAHTRAGEPLRGPILRLTARLLGSGNALAFAGAVVLGGSPGIGAAAASAGRVDRGALIVRGALLYAVLFAVFHATRPHPIGWWPSI